VADRRLLAVRPVRGGRLHPRRRQPGEHPGAPGMPGPGPAPWPPSVITTSSGRNGSGHLTVKRPIISAGVRARLPSHLSWTASRLAITRFFVRKTVFMKYCRAFVVLPGGYGTIDELSGALTLVVAGRQDHPVPRSCWPAAPADRACWTGCARRCRPGQHLRQRARPVHRGRRPRGRRQDHHPGPRRDGRHLAPLRWHLT
jgi:hypothetical protein